MIRITKVREYFPINQKTGEWELVCTGDIRETKEFKNLQEAIEWVKEDVKEHGVEFSDLEECNGNDLQVNVVEEEFDRDTGRWVKVGVNVCYWFERVSKINTRKILEKTRSG
ncbi:MAG: hypothetical protein DRM99_02345 [Thermoplasmata archaeon]|nr:MAG: hypothetical protein DRM99_02345 [Thermoplasmata archaeon]